MKRHGTVGRRAARALCLASALVFGACGDDDAFKVMDGGPADASGGGAADASSDLASAPDVGPDVSSDLAAPDLGASVDVAPDLSGEAGPMCLGPIAGCTPSAVGSCDPVCQSGCGCQQRCTISGGNSACVQPAAMPLELGATCNAAADSCRAGTVCLSEAEPTCGAHCYRFCRGNADCEPGALCAVEVQFPMTTTAMRVCSVPAEACDPTGEGRCVRPGRTLPTFGCYVMSAEAPDIAACDCAGSKKLGDACEFEHECSPGLECIRSGGTSVCRPVCRLGAAGGCPGGAACQPLGNTAKPSTVFGYCPS